MGELEPRCQILVEYAKWTAFSAVRLGPIRASESVDELLGGVAFSRVLNPSLGRISRKEFNAWHQCETNALCARATAPKPPPVEHARPQPATPFPPRWVEAHSCSKFPVGWSAKLINVYLKTAAYVGDLGRLMPPTAVFAEGWAEEGNTPRGVFSSHGRRRGTRHVACFQSRPKPRGSSMSRASRSTHRGASPARLREAQTQAVQGREPCRMRVECYW